MPAPWNQCKNSENCSREMNSRANFTVAKFRKFNRRVLPPCFDTPHCEYLLQDDEVGKTQATGRVVKSRILLLLPGSSSLLQSDRTMGRSPIEKFYQPYGKVEMIAAFAAPVLPRPLVWLDSIGKVRDLQ